MAAYADRGASRSGLSRRRTSPASVSLSRQRVRVYCEQPKAKMGNPESNHSGSPPGKNAGRFFRGLAAAIFSWSATNAATVTLPIEVVGENGTTASVTIEVPPRQAREVRSLWMQIHGLAYHDM